MIKKLLFGGFNESHQQFKKGKLEMRNVKIRIQNLRNLGIAEENHIWIVSKEIKRAN